MRSHLALALSAAILAGCASTPKGNDQVSVASQLAQRGQYKDAIAYMNQAIAINPKNTAFKKQLEQYKTMYASSLMAKVNIALGGDVTNSQLEEAQSLLEEAAQMASTPELGSARQLLNRKKKALYKTLGSDYQSAVVAINAEDWAGAAGLLQSIKNRYDNYEDVNLRLEKVKGESRKSYLSAATDALKADDIGVARVALMSLLKIEPNNGIAKIMLGQANERDNRDYFLRRAEGFAAESDWTSVQTYCEKVSAYDANDARCAELSATARENQMANLVPLINEEIAEGYLFNAAKKYIGLKDSVSDSYHTQFLQTGQQLIDAMVSAAEEATEEGNFGVAWALYTEVSNIDPYYENVAASLQDTVDSINARARRSVAVFDFGSPSNGPDAGTLVSGYLRSRLFNNASRDVKIMERERLRDILEEMKLGQTGVVSEDTAKEMGELHGIDYAIMGDVLLYKVDSNVSKSSKTVRYKIGEEIYDNIEFLNWEKANPNASKVDYRNAPQAKIMREKFAEREYDIHYGKKVAFLSLSFRITDIKTGENTRVETIDRRKSEEDSSNQGVAEADIKYDPLELPTDTELLQMLSDEVVSSMAVEVLRPLQSLEKHYFERAEDHDRRSEVQKAIEYYTYAIFDEKLKSVSASPITDTAKTRIAEMLHAYKF